MNHSQDNGNMTADVHSTTETLRDSLNTRVSAERAAYSQLQQWNRLLERKLAERTQELGRSLVERLPWRQDTQPHQYPSRSHMV